METILVATFSVFPSSLVKCEFLPHEILQKRGEMLKLALEKG